MAFTPGVRPLDVVEVDGEVVLTRRRADPGRRGRGAGQGRRAGRPPAPTSRRCEEPPDEPPASRSTSRTPTRSARHGVRQLRRGRASTPCGRPRAGSCARRRADGGLRRRDRAHQGRLGRGRLLEPQPGPAGGHVLDARRPRARAGSSSGSARGGTRWRQGRHRPGPAAHGDARGRHRGAGAAANETVTFDGEYVHLDGVELDYVYQERRPKDVPIYIGATGMQMMELTGEIADGACSTTSSRPTTTPRPWSARPRRGAGRAHARRHRPARSSWCARSTRTATPRSTWPG